jgi:Glycosyltransferase
MKVAVVVDWLAVIGGAERVLAEILTLYPQADLFAVVDFLDDRGMLEGRRVTTSFVQTLPFARRGFRSFLPVMPLAVEQWDFSGYDLVLSSSHAVAKGVIAGPDQVHVSYVHSPMRYAWDLQGQYLLSKGVRGWPARWLLHRLRLWDQLSAQRPDVLLANSAFVARRIAKCWNRPAAVVHPPVAVERFAPVARSEDFYLAVNRLVPYKRVDLMLAAFAAMPRRRLVVIGDGPEMRRLARMAPANVALLGHQSDDVVRDHLARCRAFVLAAEEDFGIAPLEAQASGKPVIALAKGGAVETLSHHGAGRPTAVFFPLQTPEALVQAVVQFENGTPIRPEDCRVNAERFSSTVFRQSLDAVVQQALNAAHPSRGKAFPISVAGEGNERHRLHVR